MDHYRAIRVIAAQEVSSEKCSNEYVLRRIFRWYSEKFHTPLHMVDDLPIYDILQHYYEAHYEALEDDKLREELYELSQTDQELSRSKIDKSREEVDNWRFERNLEKEAKEQNLKTKNKKEETQPESKFLLENNENPDIKMIFKDLNDFEDLEGLDGTGSLIGLE